MPKISVLIPAYKPDYLDLCIASVLAQNYGDYELLIGDDSEGDEVASVVSKWEDARIRYGRNPNRTGSGAANRAFLIGQAQGEYIKFLWHDDFLHPRSLELLHSVAEWSKATMVFHGRHFVDGAGRVIGSGSVVPRGQLVEFTPEHIFNMMVRGRFNYIGEPSNILVSTGALLDRPEMFEIDGRTLRFLDDVGLYVNLATAGYKIVGCGSKCSSYRVHGAQNSAPTSVIFSAGLFEWEFLNRWAADKGLLPPEGCSDVLQVIHDGYREYTDRFPELRRFLDLGVWSAGGRFLTPGFMRALEAGWSDTDARRARQRELSFGPQLTAAGRP